MDREDEEEFARRFKNLAKQIVIEITEEESLDYHTLQHKKNASAFSGVFALDDMEAVTVMKKAFLIWHRVILKSIFRSFVTLIRIRTSSRSWKILLRMRTSVT